MEDLYLARLGRPLPTGFRYLLGDPHPLVVPAADRQRFLGTYYPSLRRSVELTSRDGSFAFPAPTIRLALKVDHQPGPWAGIRWEWHEQVGGAVTRAPLWDRTTTADADAAARRAILDRVHERTVAISSLHDHDTAPPARVWPTTIAVPSKTTGDGHAIDDGGSQPTRERPARLAATATLTGMEAVDFVTRVLPALEAIDGVDVDEVDVRPSFREASAPATIALDGAPGESRDWFDLNVSVQVDNEEVPFHELFTALAQGEQHLILPSGTYFRIDRPEFEQLRALIAEAATLTDEPSQRVRVSRYQASLWEEFEGLAVLSAQARAWGRSIARLRSLESVEEVPVPTRLQATLRPYQERGYHWLNFLRAHGLGGVLADDMGLGKTVQAIALFCRCREGTGRQEPPFLVVAPTSVVGNWVAEVCRFAPDLAVTAIAETQARRNVDLATVCAGMDIVVTSYALFRLEFEKYRALPWSGLVLDEAQQVKNHQSKGHYCATRLEAPFKLAITGTPLENNLMELWSAFSIVAPGLLGDAKHFTTFYQTPIERGGDGERLARLRRRIKPLLARRTKEEVAPDLPEKLEQVIELDLNPQHRRAYDTLLHCERAKVLRLLGDLHRNRFEIFRSLTMLRQASIDPSLTDTRYGRVASTKLEALMERLAEITAEGHRVLVFSQFTRFLRRVRARLEDDGVAHCYLDGRTLRRDEVVRKFKNGEAPVFLISLKAGGLGLNLTEADYCILLDPWWNPAAEAQAVDRAHRIGQDRRVIVYRLVARDTIEEKVMALKARKAALVASVLDGGGLGDGQLTAEDIRALLE